MLHCASVKLFKNTYILNLFFSNEAGPGEEVN